MITMRRAAPGRMTITPMAAPARRAAGKDAMRLARQRARHHAVLGALRQAGRTAARRKLAGGLRR